MSDKERIAAFLARLQRDPDLASFAALLGPYQAFIGDASTIVAVVDAVLAHWQATAPSEVTT